MKTLTQDQENFAFLLARNSTLPNLYENLITQMIGETVSSETLCALKALGNKIHSMDMEKYNRDMDKFINAKLKSMGL